MPPTFYHLYKISEEWCAAVYHTLLHNQNLALLFLEHDGVQLVEALHYNPEGCEFNFGWYHWNFSLTLRFQPHYGLGSTKPLTEMSFGNISWEVRQPVHRADNFTTFVPSVLKCWCPSLLEPSGPVRPACTGIALPLTVLSVSGSHSL
jgi:hypothetical protein